MAKLPSASATWCVIVGAIGISVLVFLYGTFSFCTVFPYYRYCKSAVSSHHRPVSTVQRPLDASIVYIP